MQQADEGVQRSDGGAALSGLEIRGFRLFPHLRIERLEQTNLIAGNNDVGKSCLLEALWLYVRGGEPTVVWQLLEQRAELLPTSGLGETVVERTAGIKYLFYGRPDIEHGAIAECLIGVPDDESRTMRLGVGWFVTDSDSERGRVARAVPAADAADMPQATLRLWSQMGDGAVASHLFSSDLFRGRGDSPAVATKQCVPLLVETPELSAMGKQWDAIQGTTDEEAVLEALRIIHPDVVQLVIPQDHDGRIKPGGQTVWRIPLVQRRGTPEPLPIGSLGNGPQRVLAITLALLNARNGVLLLDEIERSLHHSVLVRVWHLIFRLARINNVQVFATTHSRDCVVAFREAAQHEQCYRDAALVTLHRTEDEDVTAQVVAGDELAANDDVEVSV